MISSTFNLLVYDPLYNGLVFFVGLVPTHDMGMAVVLLTIVARIVVYPLSKRAIQTQMAMKKIAPEVEAIKKKFPKNSPEQGKAIFALYRERDVHPFASFGLILIQFPILIGLYWVFSQGGFPEVDAAKLYSFVHVPDAVNMHFLGLIDMGAKHNIFLGVLVAASQLFYSRLSMGPRGTDTAAEATLSSDMAKSFDVQARYMFPAMFGVIAFFVVAAAPLYWLTSNLFMIGQEYATGRRWNP